MLLINKSVSMKKLLIFLFLIISNKIYSQEEFSFKLYFEDALGNRDTLILGYDENATDSIDTIWGEENIITEPWDSVLDVRIGDKTYSAWNSPVNWLTENTYLSKKQILSAYCDNNSHSARISIQFYTENYPLIISWDRTLLSDLDTCKGLSLFFGGMDFIHFDALRGTLLYGEDNIHVKPHSPQGLPEKFYVHHQYSPIDTTYTPVYDMEKYIDNGKNIGMLQFLFHKRISLSIDNKFNKTISIFPNPIKNTFSIETADDIYINQIKIYNLSGQEVYSEAIAKSQTPINLTLPNLPNGMYVVNIQTEHGVMNKKINVVN
jgi:hypothetical protein